MHRRCASRHAVPLHTFVCLTRPRRARHKVLHKNAFSDEALFRFTPQYEASSFHSDMKHSACAPYDEKMSLVDVTEYLWKMIQTLNNAAVYGKKVILSNI